VRLGLTSDTDPAPGAAEGHAGESATEIAKKLQNPVGDLISVPFENYTNFNVGPNKGTQDILEINPVVPIHVNEDWNVITRTVMPLVWSPSNQPAASPPRPDQLFRVPFTQERRERLGLGSRSGRAAPDYQQ
jgi:hypothetical protein